MKLLNKLFSKKKKPTTTTKPDWLTSLKPGDIALDCGANVGTISTQLAETGATVYAFEPNPHAFAKLKEATSKFENVHCLQQAVGATPGSVKLYMHENAEQDPVHWSTGSSLLEFKGNVNPDSFVEVECIDLCAFINALPQPVKVLKMDVEGIECEILDKMIQNKQIHDVGHLLCEMHDHKIERLKEPSDAIRKYVNDHNLTHVDLDWI